MDGGFTGGVTERIRAPHNAGNGANVDHTSRASGCGIFAQQGKHCLGQKERCFDVKIHNLVPALFWKFTQGS